MTNRIKAEGDRLLAVCLDALTTAGVDVPKRTYFSPCPPVAECDQLVVWLSRIYFGAPGAEQATPRGLQGPRTMDFAIQVLHCLPVGRAQGQPAAAATWDKFGGLVTDQIMAVYPALVADALAKECREAVGPLQTLADEGALGGFQTSYTLAL